MRGRAGDSTARASGTITSLLGFGLLEDVYMAPEQKPSDEQPAVFCAHERHERDERRHENDDRVRVIETCRPCGLRWHHCYAKRLDDEGREAWGPVGVWTTHDETLGAAPPERTQIRLDRVDGRIQRVRTTS